MAPTLGPIVRQSGKTVRKAVVQLAAPGAADADELRASVRERLAGYKVPKRIVLVENLVRSPSGKSDYRWARSVAEASLSE